MREYPIVDRSEETCENCGSLMDSVIDKEDDDASEWHRLECQKCGFRTDPEPYIEEDEDWEGDETTY